MTVPCTILIPPPQANRNPRSKERGKRILIFNNSRGGAIRRSSRKRPWSSVREGTRSVGCILSDGVCGLLVPPQSLLIRTRGISCPILFYPILSHLLPSPSYMKQLKTNSIIKPLLYSTYLPTCLPPCPPYSFHTTPLSFPSNSPILIRPFPPFLFIPFLPTYLPIYLPTCLLRAPPDNSSRTYA